MSELYYTHTVEITLNIDDWLSPKTLALYIAFVYIIKYLYLILGDPANPFCKV